MSRNDIARQDKSGSSRVQTVHTNNNIITLFSKLIAYRWHARKCLVTRMLGVPLKMIANKSFQCRLTRPTTGLPAFNKNLDLSLYSRRVFRHRISASSSDATPSSDDPANATTAAAASQQEGAAPILAAIDTTALPQDVDISERVQELQDRLIEAQRALQV